MTAKKYAEYLVSEFETNICFNPNTYSKMEAKNCALIMVNTMIGKGGFEFGMLEELYLEKVKTELEKIQDYE